jgi:hypothetical protein
MSAVCAHAGRRKEAGRTDSRRRPRRRHSRRPLLASQGRRPTRPPANSTATRGSASELAEACKDSREEERTSSPEPSSPDTMSSRLAFLRTFLPAVVVVSVVSSVPPAKPKTTAHGAQAWGRTLQSRCRRRPLLGSLGRIVAVVERLRLELARRVVLRIERRRLGLGRLVLVGVADDVCRTIGANVHLAISHRPRVNEADRESGDAPSPLRDSRRNSCPRDMFHPKRIWVRTIASSIRLGAGNVGNG